MKLIHLPWCCKTNVQTYCEVDSQTALVADLKLFFRFAGFENIASVGKSQSKKSQAKTKLYVFHIYCLPIFTTAFPSKLRPKTKKLNF